MRQRQGVSVARDSRRGRVGDWKLAQQTGGRAAFPPGTSVWGLMHGRAGKAALAVLMVAGIAIAFGGARFSLSPIALVEQSIRVAAAPVLATVYRADMAYVDKVTRRYWIGAPAAAAESASESWRRVEAAVPGLKVIGGNDGNRNAPAVPFVYEVADTAYLRDFRITHRLDEIVRGARDEYDAMGRLARWVGTRWDHGTDEVPGGNQVCEPAAVVRAGEGGAKFWCEIAARTMVHAATALGWQARVVTASRDGYTWEHAVAELWSNQFRKWFVVDADFNVVFERDGVPMSAFELVHEGERLQAGQQLKMVGFAEPKPSLPARDLIPFFAYAHVDMRNDWCSRPLRRGSPAGGDSATWWTSRNTLGPLLTASLRVDDPGKFDWEVNVTAIHAIEARRAALDIVEVEFKVGGYGPDVESVELSLNGSAWVPLPALTARLPLWPGRHRLSTRFALRSGARGPETSLILEFSP